MLADFLIKHRAEILALTREKTLVLAEARPTSDVLERGLPTFYNHLIETLGRAPELSPKPPSDIIKSMTSEHGRELSRLGYSVSQVVHGYGAICQAITEIAASLGAKIEAGEFNLFNFSLDVAIAEAVTGFEEVRSEAASRIETKRRGFLTHELRNALSTAVVAHEMIRRGVVGRAGLTNTVLEQSLTRMQDLIDRSMVDVRLDSEPRVERHPMRLAALLKEVAAASAAAAQAKRVSLTVKVDPKLRVDADRHYLSSALTNLLQNAIKFSKPGGRVTVRSQPSVRLVVLEIEDSCGGLPEGDPEALFKPYTQRGEDRTGLGLGLAISRRAVELNRGIIQLQDIPGRGCLFTIRLPKSAAKH